MIRRIATVALLLSALASSARASDLDRFLEAHEAGDWGAADRAWSALEPTSEARVTGVLLKRVDVLLHLGRTDGAQRVVEDVLEREPRNVVALATLARLRIRESEDAAKELLLDAAREGYPVLREVRSSKELAALREDPRFVLAAMRASSQFDVRGEKGRNPFAAPRLAAPPEPRKPAIVKPVSTEPRKRLEDYIRQGNGFLRAMVDDLRAERLAEVSVLLSDVKALCEAMRREPEEDFARNADELWIRASRLDGEARKLLRVKELGIVVTGVVVAPGSKSRAIIALGGRDAGRIYEEGDELRDASGERVRGLAVARIGEGVVGFRYEGIDFVRELRRGP